jgi:hypothetical protein
MYGNDDLMELYDDRYDLDDAATWEEDRIAEDHEGQDYDDGDVSDQDGQYEAVELEDGYLDASWEDAISGSEFFGGEF